MESLGKSVSRAISLNNAIESARRDRDHKMRTGVLQHDKYFVKLRDERGKEYEVRYFF